MKILQLCKKFPYPLKDGESIAVNSLSKSFQQQGCQVTLLAMNTCKHYFDMRQLPSNFNHYHSIHTVDLDNRVKPWEALKNLFSRESYHVSRFESEPFRLKLIQLLQTQEFDIIQLETIYLTPYIDTIRKHSDAIIAMRSHNVEHEIWERISNHTRFFPKKWYLQYLTKKLKAYELAQLANFDLLVSISERDLNVFKKLGFQKPSVVTPIGINSSDYTPDYRSQRGELTIGFIGSLDWIPNQEGLQWFLDNVWPIVNRKFPKLKFHIAGRNTPDWIMKMHIPNVVVHGEVPSAVDFINSHAMMIVPLLSGSGMRVKILEGMALGRTVLTTSMGLEGIHAKNNREVLIANTPVEFVNTISKCYENPMLVRQISQRARAFALQNYDNREIAINLLQAYSQLFTERFGVAPYLPEPQSKVLTSTRA